MGEILVDYTAILTCDKFQITNRTLEVLDSMIKLISLNTQPFTHGKSACNIREVMFSENL